MSTCFLYPGQGAQYPGMGRGLWEAEDEVKDLFALASDRTGKDLQHLLFEGTEEELKETDNTQIAVTLACVAASVLLRKRGIESDVCAGFSLGEYAALHDAGIVSREDIFTVVRKRGEIMAAAANALQTDEGRPGMAAVLGLDIQEASAVLRQLAGDGVYLANHSSPTQVVIAGTAEGLDKAEPLFDEAGALRYIRLRVSGPFHSPLMAEARDRLRNFLETVQFADPIKPVFANVTGEQISTADEAKKLCVDQIVSTVLWVRTEENLKAMNVDPVLEVGPGKVLAGLWKSFTKDVKCRPAGTVDDIQAVLSQYGST